MATDPSVTREESLAHLLRANEYYLKYQFTPEEIDELNAGEKDEVVDALVDKYTYGSNEHLSLLSLGVAKGFRCTHWIERLRELGPFGTMRPMEHAHFVGFLSDVKSAREFYETAKKAMDNCADRYMRSPDSESEFSPAKVRASYMSGWVQGVCDALVEQVQELGETGLMVLPPRDAIMHVNQLMRGINGGQVTSVQMPIDVDRALLAGERDGRQFGGETKGMDSAESKPNSGLLGQ